MAFELLGTQCETVEVLGTEVCELYINGSLVYTCEAAPPALAPPSYVSNFAASDNQTNTIQMTFSNASGNPSPTYELMEDGYTVNSSITSGYQLARTGPHTSIYQVVAVNSQGRSTSNDDSGTSIATDNSAPPGTITNLTASDSFVDYIEVEFGNAGGSPAPTYDLFEDNIKIESGVTSPVRVDRVGPFSADYYVNAVNSEGSANSNTDGGNSQQSGSAPDFTIDDFNATDDRINYIEMTWSPAEGDPVPTYKLYRDSIMVDGLVTSPLVYTIAGPDTASYYVEAVNSRGTDTSGANWGTSVAEAPPPTPAPGTATVCNNSVTGPSSGHFSGSGRDWTFTVPNDFLTPYDITFTATGGGGGGGGGMSGETNNDNDGAGGYPGHVSPSGVTIRGCLAGEVYAIHLGLGGLGGAGGSGDEYLPGLAGSNGERTTVKLGGSEIGYGVGGIGGELQNNYNLSNQGVQGDNSPYGAGGSAGEFTDDAGGHGGPGVCASGGGSGAGGGGDNLGVGERGGTGGNGGPGVLVVSW